MYATSRATGRVAVIERSGPRVTVTLAPVSLTDVFRDAHFTIDHAIDSSALAFQSIPELPGALSEPEPVATGVIPTATRAGARRDVDGDLVQMATALTARPIRLALTTAGRLPPARKASTKVSVGGWEVEPSLSPSKLGLRIGHKTDSGLKVFVEVAFKLSKLRIHADVPISGGRIGSGATFLIRGITGVGVSLAAGAANGATDNQGVRIELPVEITFAIPGEPLVYSNKWKFSVTTALGGNNTTLKADGEWKLDGAIGIASGELVSPVLSVTKSIMDSVRGIAVGVSGLTFAVESKMQFGIGIPAAFAGPYAKVTLSLGVTNGSAIGASFARCVGGTLDGWVGGGMGFSISSPALQVLSKLFPSNVKIEGGVERTHRFVHRSQVLPAVPTCLAMFG